MTSNLRCPFCQQELRNCCAGVIYTCSKPDSCPHEQCYGSKELWQALIRRTNQLNIAITDIHHAYKSLMGGCAEWRLYLEQTLKQIQDLDNDK